MQILKLKSIIGAILISTLLTTQVTPAYAIYSPVVAAQASKAKADIRSSREVHGVVTLDSIRKRATANEGLFTHFTGALKEIIISGLTSSFYDGFSLLLGEWLETDESITTCLRDDIWEVQALQEEILNEVMKAALLSDYEHSNLLWNDYQLLKEIVEGNTESGSTELLKDSKKKLIPTKGLKDGYDEKIWFPNSQNFYLDCPYGEFDQAFDEFDRSLENLLNTFSEGGFYSDWGSLNEAAKKRAKKRAEKWIKENQITASFGGPEGNNPRSLVNGAGIRGLMADALTQWEIIKGVGEAVFDATISPFLEAAKGDAEIDAVVVAYEEAQAAREVVMIELEKAAVFNLQLNNVSEESLAGIDQTLFFINEEIKRAFTTNSSSANIVTFCQKLNFIAKNQCKNKGPETINCKE